MCGRLGPGAFLDGHDRFLQFAQVLQSSLIFFCFCESSFIMRAAVLSGLPGRHGISLRSPSLHQHLPPLFLLHGVLSDKSSENSPDAHRGILRLALHFSEYRFLPVLSDSCEVSPFLRIAAERKRFSEIDRKSVV